MAGESREASLSSTHLCPDLCSLNETTETMIYGLLGQQTSDKRRKKYLLIISAMDLAGVRGVTTPRVPDTPKRSIPLPHRLHRCAKTTTKLVSCV